MNGKTFKMAQAEGEQTGGLQINVTSDIGLIPIQNAVISIAYTRSGNTGDGYIRADGGSAAFRTAAVLQPDAGITNALFRVQCNRAGAGI